jgi:hypothetical protein
MVRTIPKHTKNGVKTYPMYPVSKYITITRPTPFSQGQIWVSPSDNFGVPTNNTKSWLSKVKLL